MGVLLDVPLPKTFVPNPSGSKKNYTTDVWSRMMLNVFNGWSRQLYSVLLVECSGNNCIMVHRSLDGAECEQLHQAQHVDQVPYQMLWGPVKSLDSKRLRMIREHITNTKHPVVAIEHKKIIIYFVPGYDMASIGSLSLHLLLMLA